MVAWTLWGCSGVECGPGTKEVDGQCVPADAVGDDDDDTNAGDDDDTNGDDDDDTTAAQPELVTLPASLSLGDVGVGCTASTEIEVENAGDRDLTVSDATVPAGWAVSFTPVVTVAPGESFTLELSVSPTDDVALDGVLRLSSNDPRGAIDVPVAATGVYEAHTEIVEVPTAAVDVLLLIDHSCSMQDDNQTDVEVGMPLLVDSLTLGWDWNLALVTADDGCVNGALLDASSPDAAQYLVDHAFDAGPVAGPYLTEALLELAARALNQTGAGQCNEGLLRADTPLLILMLSDEVEQSGTPAATWVSRYQTFADPVVVSGAFDLNYLCGDGSGPGGYADAVALTGGTSLNICGPWGNQASQLTSGVPLAPPDLAVVLSGTPAEDPTEVRVDGAVITTWTWDPATNTVTVPGPFVGGEEIQIDWPGASTCP